MRIIAARFTLLLTAVGAVVAGWALIIAAGLPQRADFTGRMVEGLGRVAPEKGALAPPFTLTTLDGNTLNLLALRGEPVVVNFWATWCAPCLAEMPALQNLHEATGVRIVAINLGESRPIIAQWVNTHGLTFDILLDPFMEVARDYRILGQPSTYVVSSDGIITHVFYGPVSMRALEGAIDSLQSNG